MDETSATITIKKVDQKKKKEEEEVVEETIEIEEEEEDEDLPAEVKRGPFGVLLTKAKQNKSVISVSSRSSKYSFHVVSVAVFSGNTCCVNPFQCVHIFVTNSFHVKTICVWTATFLFCL